jgi:hypothetical protein
VPLVTENIVEARTAYTALELRASSAETLADALRFQLADVKKRLPESFELIDKIRQHAVDREGDNAQLQTKVDQALQSTADIPLQNFIASLGLAAAIAEATMPDRTIPSVAVTVQSHVAILPDSTLGLRFFQPGVMSDSTSLTSTSLEIARVALHDGQPVPRGFYSVLEDALATFAAPFWAQFTTATQPPVQPATELVVAITTFLANTAAWSFPFLLSAAGAIGDLEKSLATLAAAVFPGDTAAAFGSAVDSLQSLVKALTPKAVPVVGDLLALAASLDAATRIARTVAS